MKNIFPHIQDEPESLQVVLSFFNRLTIDGFENIRLATSFSRSPTSDETLGVAVVWRQSWRDRRRGVTDKTMNEL